MEKMTEKKMYAALLEKVQGDEILTAFINKKLEQLANRAANKKAEAVRIENESLKANILKFLTSNSGQNFTVSKLINTVECLNGLSTSKVSFLVNALVAEGSAKKSIIGRISYFSVED